MRLVQLGRGNERTVAIVNGNVLRLLQKWTTVYDLALEAIRRGVSLTEFAQKAASGDTLDYDPIYSGVSEWRLISPVDHPEDPARLMVSGTGLTHKVSAENRAAMHRDATPTITDSMRMFQLGKEGGQPGAGSVGVQPEWFYKGNGSILCAHGEALNVPCYALDGGEEPEIAGAYVIADDGRPRRIGFMAGNEFSDHVMEKQNYLYLAHSKLRNCSVGPELVVGGRELFHDLAGTVKVERNGTALWKASVYSGEKNMCHSLANLEHHHFKYEAHRRPGDVHVHFFGADAFSFGEGVRLGDGDVAEVSFPSLGRPLRNPVRIQPEKETLVAIAPVG
jgi:hypothetical protein